MDEEPILSILYKGVGSSIPPYSNRLNLYRSSPIIDSAYYLLSYFL